MEMSDEPPENLLLNVTYGDFEASFYLSQSDTVGDLKKKIYEKMEISPSNQIIECWYKYPEDDDDTLGKCCESDTTYLVVYNSDYLPKRVLVTDASNHFIEYFSNNFYDGQISFDVDHLGDVIQQTCFGSLESRKFLLLYLHKKEDSFANFFVKNLMRPEVKEIIKDRFFLLGWDIENSEYHEVLTEALISQSELANLADFMESKICAALLLVPIKNSFTVFSCMTDAGEISEKSFLETLKKTNEFFVSINQIAGSTDYQQLILNSLGDRDYDSFDHFEFDRLKEKIGFALYGPPKKLDGYEEKEKEKSEVGPPKKLEGCEEKEKIEVGPPKKLGYEEKKKIGVDPPKKLEGYEEKEKEKSEVGPPKKLGYEEKKKIGVDPPKKLDGYEEKEKEKSEVGPPKKLEGCEEKEKIEVGPPKKLGYEEKKKIGVDPPKKLEGYEEKEKEKIEVGPPKVLDGHEEKEKAKIEVGPPNILDGYDEKEKKKIEHLFKIIVKQNNKFAKWKDRVTISFIFNCTVPLVIEKKKASKDYNPYTDIASIPLFVLRKCKKSENPCRVIIDDSGRVYKSWEAYLSENKLPECKMILPKNGRYQADQNGNVLLERHLSPACGIGTKVLQGTDIASVAGGLVSGGIFVAAAIPAVAVAPAALIAAAATGIGVGLYSIGRSAYTLIDRGMHEETLSVANSEARGAYLNIVAGTLGFVGAGANVAVSQLAARGFNISQGATAAVNGINVVNISASGITVVNSVYDVIDQWWNENQKPSIFTIVQLSSSVLFFGHAVFNFRMVGTMVEESQANTLKDYQKSLRSNRHRKTFNKMMKETIRQNDGNLQRGQAEVIKTIRQIQNKDEVFATLTRLNKKMNRNNVKFSASNGGITLNGVSIDMAKFGAMDNNMAATFFGTLPNTPEPTQKDIRVMHSRLSVPFRGTPALEIARLSMVFLKIFSNTEKSIEERIINALAAIVKKLLVDLPGCYRELDNMFPGCRLMRIFTMVIGFFQTLVDQVEEQYQKWLATKDPKYEKPIFLDLALEYSKRAIQIFNFVSRVYFIGNNLTEEGLKELIVYFYTWFTKQVCEFKESSQRKERRIKDSGLPARRKKCPVCHGFTYQGFS